MNAYQVLTDKQQKEVDAFPMFFAFSNAEFEEGMKQFGLAPTDTKKICKLGPTGGYCRKTDFPLLKEMLIRHGHQLSEAIEQDKTGDNFIYEMFNYELGNHEYGVTGDADETLNALGFTMDEIKKNPALLHGFQKAQKNQRKYH